MAVERFGSHFLQNALINLISLPVCHIFNALSADTHIGYRNSHNAIWPYSHNGQIMAIWPYSHMAIWRLEYPRWVATERAIKMWHLGKEFKLIRPFREK